MARIKTTFSGSSSFSLFTYADHDSADLASVWNSAWGQAHRPGPAMDWSTTPVADVYRYDQDDIARIDIGKVLVSTNQGPVFIAAYNGDNVIVGGGFDDTLMGGKGSDFVLAGAGDDSVFGGAGDDCLYGQAGNDTIKDGSGADKVFGGSGDDVLHSTGMGTLYGPWENQPDGPDLFAGGSGSDWVSYVYADRGAIASLADPSMNGGAAATDTFNSIENLGGSRFDDWLIGDAGANILAGDDGHDTLSGGDGDDTIYGGTGNDYLFGDGGADYIEGGDGEDVVFAGAGNDVIVGSGADMLFGEDGDDVFFNLEGGSHASGGNGIDSAILSGTAADWLVEDMGSVIGADGVTETHLYELRQLQSDGSFGERLYLDSIEQIAFSDGSLLYL